MQSQINSISNYPVRSVSIRMPHPMRWFSVAVQVLGVLRQRRPLTSHDRSGPALLGLARELDHSQHLGEVRASIFSRVWIAVKDVKTSFSFGVTPLSRTTA